MATATETKNGSPLQQLGAMQEQAEAQIQAAKDAMGDFNEKALHFIKERPGLCLVGAVAVGFVVGRIVSRR